MVLPPLSTRSPYIRSNTKQNKLTSKTNADYTNKILKIIIINKRRIH